MIHPKPFILKEKKYKKPKNKKNEENNQNDLNFSPFNISGGKSSRNRNRTYLDDIRIKKTNRNTNSSVKKSSKRQNKNVDNFLKLGSFIC